MYNARTSISLDFSPGAKTKATSADTADLWVSILKISNSCYKGTHTQNKVVRAKIYIECSDRFAAIILFQEITIKNQFDRLRKIF